MRKPFFVVLSLLVICLSCQTAQIRELAIEQRDRGFNGIQVGTPKVYDDALLQQHVMSLRQPVVASGGFGRSIWNRFLRAGKIHGTATRRTTLSTLSA
jgi:imidazole glycerol phosphate synthase subunit HisF